MAVTPYHLDRLIGNIYDSYVTTTGTHSTNYVNSWHTVLSDDGYVLEATMVGIGKNDLKVTVVGNTLVVEGTPNVKSRYATAFKRSWALADDADVTQVNARLENGLLTVNIPRVKPTSRTIPVTVQ